MVVRRKPAIIEQFGNVKEYGFNGEGIEGIEEQ